MLCAGTSLGAYLFVLRIPALRTFSEHAQETAILQGVPSLARFGLFLLFANLALFVLWLLYSAILAKTTRRDFMETAQQDALTYLPLCVLSAAWLRFDSLLTYYFEGLWFLAETAAPFLLLIALLGVCYLKIAQFDAPRRLWRESAAPLDTPPAPSWKLALSLFLASLIVYALVGFRLKTTNGAGGDEPHYLLITHSLVHDRDAQVGNNYKKRDYQAFFQGTLDPHLSIAKNQRRYSIHPIGMPLLLVPAYALKQGYTAPILTMNLMAACLSVLIFCIAEALTGQRRLALLLWGVLSFTPPLLFYSSQLYPETPSALFLAAAFYLIYTQRRRQAWRAVAIGLLLAYLPWLQQRMILPSVFLWGYHLYRLRALPERRPHFGIEAGISTFFLAVSGLGMAGYYYALFGNPLPNAPYKSVGVAQVFSAEIFWREGLLGLLFDQETGLFIFAPYMMFAGAGLLILLRKKLSLALLTLTLILSIYIPCAGFTLKWRGAWSPAARYMVAMIPILLIPLSIGLSHRSRTAYRYLFALFVLMAFGWSLYFLRDPFSLLMWNRGINPLFTELSRVIDVTRYFPSFTEQGRGNFALTAAWIGGIAIMTLDLHRRAATPPCELPRSTPGIAGQLSALVFVYASVITLFGAWTFLRVQLEYHSSILGGHNRAVRRFLEHDDHQAALRYQAVSLDAVAPSDLRFAYVSREKVGHAEKTPPSFIVSGPHEAFRKGAYRAYFFINLRPSGSAESVVTLQIVAETGTRLFAERTLSPADFPAVNEACSFVLPFDLPEDVRDLETRVYFHGFHDVTVTRILIEPGLNSARTGSLP